MSGLVSPNVLEQIRAASDIVEVIGGYVPLKRAGANHRALCPFHREKSPSFHVNQHRQTFHCFGCHKGGDVFTFVQEYESVGFGEAVRRLAERAHIVIEYDAQPGQKQARELKETLLQIHDQIAQRWQNALGNEASAQIARDYLAKRQVSPEAVKLFRLGYAPDLWDDTVNWAKSKGFSLEIMEQAGLIIKREGSEGYYDRFRGRLMFPICDEQGRVVAFSGRVLSGDEKTAKYVNSPETAIFTKGKVFYGLDKAKRAILEKGFAIICEGQLDLIACYMSGTQNMVAPQGTAFTNEHARILKRYVNEVILCFDSDNAGQKAAVRVLDSLLNSGLAIRVAVVPAPHDPDSFIKAHGGAAFQEIIQHAEGFFDYYLSRLCATNEIATDRGRLAVLHDMALAVNKTGNQVLLDIYAQKTAYRLGVSPEAVRMEFRKAPAPTHNESAEYTEDHLPDTPPAERPTPLEFWFLRLLLLADDLVPWVAQRMDVQWLQHETVRRLYALRMAYYYNESWVSIPSFLSDLEEPELKQLITESVTEERPIPEPEKQMRDVVIRLRDEYIKRQHNLIITQLSHPDTSAEQQVHLVAQQNTLRAIRQQEL